jgi:hypothetical protein
MLSGFSALARRCRIRQAGRTAGTPALVAVLVAWH